MTTAPTIHKKLEIFYFVANDGLQIRKSLDNAKFAIIRSLRHSRLPAI